MKIGIMLHTCNTKQVECKTKIGTLCGFLAEVTVITHVCFIAQQIRSPWSRFPQN